VKLKENFYFKVGSIKFAGYQVAYITWGNTFYLITHERECNNAMKDNVNTCSQ
jgi:hypothetical protein